MATRQATTTADALAFLFSHPSCMARTLPPARGRPPRFLIGRRAASRKGGVSLDLDTGAAADTVYRVLSDDGSALVADPPDVSDDDLVAVMAEMVKARVANGRFFSLQRQGRSGTYAPIEGQEAAVVGAVAALDPARDWVLPQYREPVALGRSGPEVLRTY